MKVLVTGAAGFIGSHTCERLLRAGHDVTGIDDLSTGTLDNLSGPLHSEGFRLAQLDIVSAEAADLVRTTRPDVLVHLAAQMDVRKSVADPLADARVNVLGTVQVLTAAAQAGTTRIVFASSGGTVYGEPGASPVPEDAALSPLSPYGAAKVSGEAYVAAFGGLYGLSTCSLALANVYGPRQDPRGEAGVVAIFARALLSGRTTRIFGDGDAVRDYVYVDDVVGAIGLAVDGAGDGERINIGTGVGTSVRALHSLLAAAAGTEDQPLLAPPRAGELRHVVLDVSKAERVMGWAPEVRLEEGLAATLRWVRTQELR